jgi:hypothetical protein
LFHIISSIDIVYDVIVVIKCKGYNINVVFVQIERPEYEWKRLNTNEKGDP